MIHLHLAIAPELDI